jgi:hypothetical protein
MSKTMVEMAEAVFRKLGAQAENPYNLPNAHIFAVQGNGEIRTIITAGDIYEALDEVASKPLASGDLVLGCETTGWASPITDDDDGEEIAPSQHPQRRRVRLVALVSRKYEMASALGFADDDEVITDDGQARGTLADALADAMRSMVARNN